MKVLFAGGGTGGHLIPGLCIAGALRAKNPLADCVFAVTGRPIEKAVLGADEEKGRIRTIVLDAPRWKGALLAPVFGFKFLSALWKSRRLLKREKPNLVIGLGGYGSLPCVMAAEILGIPTALLSVDSIPGQANRLLSRYVDEVWLPNSEAAKQFPKAKKTLATGIPIREALFKADRGVISAKLELEWAKPTVLVTGGSQGARGLNRLVVDMLHLAQQEKIHFQIMHVCGPREYDAMIQEYRHVYMKNRLMPYYHDMDHLYSCSDLVIARGGAITLAEISALEVPAIIIPFPGAKDDHQRVNAENMKHGGYWKVLDEKKCGADNLLEVLKQGLGFKSRRIPEAPKRFPQELIVERIESLIFAKKDSEEKRDREIAGHS